MSAGPRWSHSCSLSLSRSLYLALSLSLAASLALHLSRSRCLSSTLATPNTPRSLTMSAGPVVSSIDTVMVLASYLHQEFWVLGSQIRIHGLEFFGVLGIKFTD